MTNYEFIQNMLAGLVVIFAPYVIAAVVFYVFGFWPAVVATVFVAMFSGWILSGICTELFWS